MLNFLRRMSLPRQNGHQRAPSGPGFSVKIPAAVPEEICRGIGGESRTGGCLPSLLRLPRCHRAGAYIVEAVGESFNQPALRSIVRTSGGPGSVVGGDRQRRRTGQSVRPEPGEGRDPGDDGGVSLGGLGASTSKRVASR